MSELLRRGQASSQVSDWHVSSDEVTAPSQQSFFAPHGLTLQQTITSSGSVTIPAGINWVYVIMTGAGGGGDFSGGQGGMVSWGWTLAQNTCIIGAGVSGTAGGYTRYGHIIAGGGGTRSSFGGLGGSNNVANYYGMPMGSGFINNGNDGNPGASGGLGRTDSGGKGGDGISGGGGGGGAIVNGGNGGSGLVGGGGGRGFVTTSGGNGGNGIGIDGTIYTGGAGLGSGGSGGGGAGIAGNGGNATAGSPFAGAGGLGGGGSGAGGGAFGTGGNGILYIFY